MTETKRVLVVGGDMFLGHLLRDRLPQMGYRVRAIDDRALSPRREDERVVGHLSDRDLLVSACQDVDFVIDLSKLDLGRWQDGDIAELTQGVATLWDAAKVAGVKRVITLNSDGIVGFYRRSMVLDHLSVPRPDGPSGLCGALSESMASLYAFKHGISALCIRMGACRPEPVDERMLSTWISPNDFMRLIQMGLTADYVCEVVYGISANARSWWDNSNAHRLGYRPLDRAELYAESLRDRRSSNVVANVFQGGPTAALNFSGDIRRIP